MESLERGLFILPPCSVPELQNKMHDGTDMQRYGLGFRQAKHVAEVELQPTLMKCRESGRRNIGEQFINGSGFVLPDFNHRLFQRGNHLPLAG